MSSERSAPAKPSIIAIDNAHCIGRVDTKFASTLDALLAGGGLEALQCLPGFVEVKRSTVRTILRGVAGSAPVHVKLFRTTSLSDRARDALRGSRGVRELDNLVAARKRGLPAVEPLAAGTLRGSLGSRSFLITRTARGEPLPRGPLLPETAAAAGALLRRAHDNGLLARDLHPGNVLADPEDELVLLDLTSASFTAPLEEAERAQGLAFFCQDLDGGVLDPDALPLLAAYGATERLIERAARLGLQLARKRVLACAKRATRDCKETELSRAPHGARDHWHRPAAALHAAAREALAGLGAAQPLREGRRGGIWLFPALVVKSRPRAAARRLFAAAYLLRACDVPRPEPVLLRLLPERGYVVTRRAPWPDLAAELRDGALDRGSLLRAAGSLGRSFGRMHARGLRNRDAKLENLVLDRDRQEVLFVDLDGIRTKSPHDSRGQGADLGRLLAAFSAGAGRLPRALVLRALGKFRRSYLAARERMLHALPSPQLWRIAEQRARAWKSAHSSLSGAEATRTS